MARKRKSRRSPGEGSVYFRKDTGKYEGAVVIGLTPAGNSRRIKKSFTTATEAREWVAEQNAALAGGAKLDRNASLQEAYEEWMAAGETLNGWLPATTANYKAVVGKHVLPVLGRMRVRDVSPTDVRALLQGLLKGGASTDLVRRVRKYLSMLLLDARRMRLTSINAAEDVPAPTAAKPVVQRWTEEEAAAVLRQCLKQDDQVARYVRVALGTGMRPEELLGLTWAAVDVPNQVLEVVQVATEVGGHPELRRGGKTVAAERPVTFDEYTAAAFIAQLEHVRELRRLRAAFNVKRAVEDRDAIEWTDLDLVFPSERGTVWSRAVLRRGFDKLQAASKIEETDKVVTRITLKATRATHASLLADWGANLVAVGQRFGHTRLRHTEPYLRGSEAAQRALSEMMGGLLASAARGSSGADGTGLPVTAASHSDSSDSEQAA